MAPESSNQLPRMSSPTYQRAESAYKNMIEDSIYIPRTGDTIHVEILPWGRHDIEKSIFISDKDEKDEIAENDLISLKYDNDEEEIFVIDKIGDDYIDIKSRYLGAKLLHSLNDDIWVMETRWIRRNEIYPDPYDRDKYFHGVITFLGPSNLTEENVRQTLLELVTQIEDSNLPLNYYIPTKTYVPGGFMTESETIELPMIIEARTYPGAIIAYMNWLERSGTQYDEGFLGWDDIDHIMGELIGTIRGDWLEIVVNYHDAGLKKIEPQNIARIEPISYIKSGRKI